MHDGGTALVIQDVTSPVQGRQVDHCIDIAHVQTDPASARHGGVRGCVQIQLVCMARRGLEPDNGILAVRLHRRISGGKSAGNPQLLGGRHADGIARMVGNDERGLAIAQRTEQQLSAGKGNVVQIARREDQCPVIRVRILAQRKHLDLLGIAKVAWSLGRRLAIRVPD
ncbi:hypothetical protein D3C85_1247880 [compost metagenome]